jgi:NAD(P)-dependent dehydrogenase (short-subunit alcohol dehydrogenase family)
MTDDAGTDALGLRGKVCVVTGAGSGIGRGIAVAFGRVGARVAVLDMSVEGAEGTCEEIKRSGGEAVAIACDVSDWKSVEHAAEKSAATLAPCDVLVNNAGILRPGGLDTLTLEEWNKVLSVNLTGCFICAQVFARQMRPKGKGALVHIASISASQATPLAGAYSIAKAGVAMLSKVLAVEWGPHGIRSNSVNPGMIMTPMVEAVYEQPGILERRSKAVPVGRIGRPEDIAEAAVFLASDKASYISGGEITVDGGFTQTIMTTRAGVQRPGE